MTWQRSLVRAQYHPPFDKFNPPFWWVFCIVTTTTRFIFLSPRLLGEKLAPVRAQYHPPFFKNKNSLEKTREFFETVFFLGCVSCKICFSTLFYCCSNCFNEFFCWFQKIKIAFSHEINVTIVDHCSEFTIYPCRFKTSKTSKYAMNAFLPYFL